SELSWRAPGNRQDVLPLSVRCYCGQMKLSRQAYVNAAPTVAPRAASDPLPRPVDCRRPETSVLPSLLSSHPSDRDPVQSSNLTEVFRLLSAAMIWQAATGEARVDARWRSPQIAT